MKCIFCFADEAKIYFDKKERPYFFCSLCSNRIFFRSSLSLRAIMVWVETAKSLSQEQFLAALKNVEGTKVLNTPQIRAWCEKSLNTDDVVLKEEIHQ